MIDLNTTPICVVGGGNIALRKVKKIIQQGGAVRCVAKEFLEEFKTLEKTELIYKQYDIELIKNSTIVIAATNVKELNKRILYDCRELNILCSSVSSSLEGDFIIPASIVKDEFVISFSTLGKSPAFAKKLMNEIYDLVNNKYLNKIVLLGKIREKVLKSYTDTKEKKKYLNKIIDLEEKELEEELKKYH